MGGDGGGETKSLQGDRRVSPYAMNLNDVVGVGVVNGNVDAPSTPGSLLGSASPGSVTGTDFGNETQSETTLKRYSPLAVAVKGHQSKVCQILIEADANPNVEDGTGKKEECGRDSSKKGSAGATLRECT